jgi:hypothetical protein
MGENKMIKLIDILLELNLSGHYIERKKGRVTNIDRVIVSKEALGKFTLNQIQKPLIEKIQDIVFDRLKKLESKDIPLSQNFNIVNKIFVPVLKSNGKKYPITIISKEGTGNFYYVVIHNNKLITIILSSSDDIYNDAIKHLERKDKDIPVKVLEYENALVQIDLDELMGEKKETEEKEIRKEDLPYKVRTDYRIGANLEHETYGTGKIVATSSGNRGTADSRGMLDWVEVDFGKPYLSGGKFLKTRKIPNIYSSIYFLDDKLKETSNPQSGKAAPHGSGYAPVKELVTDTEVICDNCGWEWDITNGGDDLYICHKCNHDNTPKS